MNEEIYNGDQMVMLQECKRKKAYNYMFNKWWMSNEHEVPENSVTIWNIDPEVDEEIIYELFSKG